MLLLALEDGDRRLQDRCARKLLIHGSIPGLGLHYMTKVLPGQLVPTVEAWLDSLDHNGPPPLVFLDTLGKVMPPKTMGETDYMRDYRVAGRLKALADSWPAWGSSHCTTTERRGWKTSSTPPSRTNGIAGAADTIIVINRRRTEEEGRFLVTGRDVNNASTPSRSADAAGVSTVAASTPPRMPPPSGAPPTTWATAAPTSCATPPHTPRASERKT